ncbi:MAG: hypothetical protein OEV78_00245 [Spirochaetia bacterium]|nr:hypothetical protein [Spirochaetia bacterium]
MSQYKFNLIKDDLFLLYINIAGTSIAIISAIFHLGWISATIDITIVSTLYLIHILRRKDPLLTKMLVFGISAGLAELFADHWLVSIKQTLVYNPGGWFLWNSPVYMPFSWAGMLLSISCLGLYLVMRMPLWKASLLAAVVMGVYVPSYEALANFANWWLYKNAPMLGSVPWFIILGEFLTALPLTIIGIQIFKRGVFFAAFSGALGGVWIWCAYAIAWRITGS